MQRLSSGWLVLLVLTVVPRAYAATVPFTATLRLELPPSASLVAEVEGQGVAVVHGTPIQSLSLRAGVLSAHGVVPITDPAASPYFGIDLSLENGAGAFTGPLPGSLAGSMPLQGVARLCVFAPCPSPIATVSFPLSPVGAGGSATAVSGQIHVTVIGQPWTVGTASYTVFGSPAGTVMGLAHGPISATSTVAQTGGTLQLVSPAAIDGNHLGVDRPLPAFATLTIEFVPEPRSALLVAATATLLALSWRGLRRRSS
jgi:hypothetical protein